ncbi:MAG: ATP-grasp domain-containing protein, partial [Planctomycetota bacterium]
MKIHEYQAKELFRTAGLAVPNGRVCATADEVAAAYDELASAVAVVKAQIHAGGRGKGGGVKLVRSKDEAREAGEAILGMMLKTPQTGADGQLVRKVWVEEGSDIAKEYYVGIVLDPHLAHELAVGAGLRRLQHHPEDGLARLARLV